MPNVVPLTKTGALTRGDGAMLKLFKRTVGKHLNPTELDEAIIWTEMYGANPFTKDIYFFVFDADDAEKRRMVPVLSIGLYRKIAKRTGDYRPDDRPARFTIDEALVSPSNPKGILDCEVSVYQFVHGEWFPITLRLKWEERAPIVRGGAEGFDWEPVVDAAGKPVLHTSGNRIGKQKFRKKAKGDVVDMLDPSKKNWATMPETMLAKCVEAACIRKGWPNETAGSYVDGELDKADVIDLTATEVIEQEEKRERIERVGGANALIVSWDKDNPTEAVPAGKFYDRVDEYLNTMLAEGQEQVGEVLAWAERNRAALRQHWALEKDAALKIKQRLEAIKASSGDQA